MDPANHKGSQLSDLETDDKYERLQARIDGWRKEHRDPIKLLEEARPKVENKDLLTAIERSLSELQAERDKQLKEDGRIFWFTLSENDKASAVVNEVITNKIGEHAARKVSRSTTEIVNYIGRPDDKVDFKDENGVTIKVGAKTRGLVVGYVQSGKTINFTSLIAKAIDGGFRIVVVLSGLTSSLRRQTQSRIDSDLIEPFWEWSEESKSGTPTIVSWTGSGSTKALPDADNEAPSRGDSDLNTSLLNTADVKNITNSKATVFVCKKNAIILNNLNELFKNHPGLADLPILVIDDEADQASINTAPRQTISAINNGEETESETKARSAINKAISHLLNGDPEVKKDESGAPSNKRRTAYVGYTATPFAVLLMNPNDCKDLYPKDFIVSLDKPKGYFGSAELFGYDQEVNVEPEEAFDPDFIRHVPDDESMVVRPLTEAELAKINARNKDDSKNKEEPAAELEGKFCLFASEVPPKMTEAINWFLLATAARRARGQKKKPSSMLIHTDFKIETHERLAEIVEDYVGELRRKASTDSSLSELKNDMAGLWESEQGRNPAFENEQTDFQAVWDQFAEVLAAVEIIVDNSKSEERFENRFKMINGSNDRGQTIIAIGGNTFARGLTLEGLCSSYFVRKSKTYDTLLQMCRWFGFRPGYGDLCRIWMTKQMEEWFQSLSRIELDVRDQIDQMKATYRTPEQVRIRIQTHADLGVSSTNKMRDAVCSNRSFSGKTVQTIWFSHKNTDVLDNNVKATRELVGNLLDTSQVKGPFEKENGTQLFTDVPTRLVKKFLENYNFCERQFPEGAEPLINYIINESAARSITSWNISFFGKTKQENETEDLFNISPDGKDKILVKRIERSQLIHVDLDGDETEVDAHPDQANIKALCGPKDILNDVDRSTAAYSQAYASTIRRFHEDKNDFKELQYRHRRDIRRQLQPQTGHLGIYVVDPNSKANSNSNANSSDGESKKRQNRRKDMNAAGDIIGVALHFPSSSEEQNTQDFVTREKTVRNLFDEDEEI